MLVVELGIKDSIIILISLEIPFLVITFGTVFKLLKLNNAVKYHLDFDSRPRQNTKCLGSLTVNCH